MKNIIVFALSAMTSCAGLAADAVQSPSGQATTPEEKPAMTAPANPIVKMSTSLGDVTIELFADKAPISVANFLAYVDANFYDGTIFHRVIPNFMIQGGGFTADMAQKTTRGQIKNEADNGVLNTRGTLAMARTAVVDSATSQFFVNTTDNGFLNFKGKNPQGYGYAVFGKVIKGMDVIDQIEKVKTANKGPHQNVPVEAVTILSIKRLAPEAK